MCLRVSSREKKKNRNSPSRKTVGDKQAPPLASHHSLVSPSEKGKSSCSRSHKFKPRAMRIRLFASFQRSRSEAGHDLLNCDQTSDPDFCIWLLGSFMPKIMVEKATWREDPPPASGGMGLNCWRTGGRSRVPGRLRQIWNVSRPLAPRKACSERCTAPGTWQPISVMVRCARCTATALPSLIGRLLGRERFEIGFFRVSGEAAEGMADHEEEQGKQQGAQQRGPN